MPSPPDPATPSPPASLSPPPRFVVTASALRLRARPAALARVLGELLRGTLVERLDLSPDGLWSLVRVNAKAGWMASKYLAPASHPAAPSELVEEFPWMPIALAELGVREVPGPAVNARIALYQSSSELDRNLAADDERPWCSDFVGWCVEHAGFAGTNSAAARSWLDWGQPLTIPRRGCITILARGATGGHVGFFVSSPEPHQLRLLGGNQGDQVSLADFDRVRLLGYRVPAR